MSKIRNMKLLDKFSFAVIVIGVLYFGVHFLIL